MTELAELDAEIVDRKERKLDERYGRADDKATGENPTFAESFTYLLVKSPEEEALIPEASVAPFVKQMTENGKIL
jgi:hypothetical protein